MIDLSMNKLVVKTSLLLSGFLPTVASAEPFDPTDADPTLPTLPTAAPENFAGVIGVIVTIAQWMFGLLMALSIVFILYAAFMYIIAQGNQERIDTAKKILIYAVVGLVVAVMAGGGGVVVQNFLASSAGNQ